MTGLTKTDMEAKRLAREDYGHEDLQVRLGISALHARVIVFGRAAAARWWKWQQERGREAS